MKTLLTSFGEYIETASSQPLTPDVLHAARRALLDWQGALIAGSNSDVAQKLIAAYQPEFGYGNCAVAGTDLKTTPRAAAFLNGSIAHIAEFDDIYRNGAYHPACPTISAAWVCATQQGLTLDALLKAIVIGYEVSTRIAEVIQPSHYKYFHTTGTVGVFGAAAACSSLLGLSAEQSMNALATAGTFASGLQQAFRSDSMTKPLHAGHAAEVGINAAYCALAGMTGTPDILEGDAGFGAAMSQNPRWGEVLNGLGKVFNITQMTFKNHGCCGHTFPAIDGAQYLTRLHQIDTNAIKKIEILVYQASADVCAYRHPQTPFEAKFSLTHTVACGMILGAVREKAFAQEQLGNDKIQQLEDKISYQVDPAITSLFPKVRSAKVRIEMNSGEVFEHHQQTRHGDPDDPLTDDELNEKFQELSTTRVGEIAVRDLSALIWQGENNLVANLSSYWRLQA
jgi:2-methylcitrate dehydratase PrpD